MSLQIPAIDEITDTYAVFGTERRHLALTPAVGALLSGATIERVRPLLLSADDAVVSPHLVMEMVRTGGRWVVRTPELQLLDALSQRVVTTLQQAADLDLQDGLPQLPRPVAEDAVGVLTVEVIVHHRATAELVVGGLAEDIATALGQPAPDLWGSTEPLTHAWRRTELTSLARSHMPTTPLVRATSPTGAAFVMRWDRTPHGLNERVRAMLPLGPYARAAQDVAHQTAEAFAQLSDRYSVVLAMGSLSDMDPDVRFGFGHRVRTHRPEVPTAVLLGPWSVREARVDVDAMVAHHGARLLGRRRVPSLLFDLDGDRGAPWLQMLKAMDAIGPEHIARALGIDPSRAQHTGSMDEEA